MQDILGWGPKTNRDTLTVSGAPGTFALGKNNINAAPTYPERSGILWSY